MREQRLPSPRDRVTAVVAFGALMVAVSIGVTAYRQLTWGGTRWTDWASPLGVLASLGLMHSVARGAPRPWHRWASVALIVLAVATVAALLTRDR